MDALARRLKTILVDLIENGYRYFGVGGALGFDTLAAQTVLDLKTSYPHIKLILVLPCLSQADSWSLHDQRRQQIRLSIHFVNIPRDVCTSVIAIWSITVVPVFAI